MAQVCEAQKQTVRFKVSPVGACMAVKGEVV